MPPRFLVLDSSVGGSQATQADFGSLYTIFEHDIVIWDINNTYAGYTANARRTFQNRPQLNEDESAATISDISRRRKDFADFLALGRTLVVLVPGRCDFYYDTGERTHSGTGRNRLSTTIVEPTSLLNALPFTLELSEVLGTAVQGRRADFQRLVRETARCWLYRATLTTFPGAPIATVDGTDKVVGSYDDTSFPGKIILIPDFYGGGVEDDESGIGGPPEPDDEEKEARQSQNIDRLLKWISDVHGKDESAALPTWVRDRPLLENRKRSAGLASLERQMGELQENISQLQREYAEDEEWMHLVASSGDSLERQASAAFSLLGFEVEPAVPGRRDLRLKHGDRLAVVEIKGVTKSAAEAHAAQLEKWASEAYLEYDVPHKPILLVNSWRDRPVDERQDSTFPDQMLTYATSRNHCLLSGLQLLLMVRAVKAGRANAGDVVSQLLSTVGTVEGWADLEGAFGTAEASELSDGRVTDPGS